MKILFFLKRRIALLMQKENEVVKFFQELGDAIP